MAVPVEAVESIVGFPQQAKGKKPLERRSPRRAPKDEVSLSHPNDERTLQLLLQILADSLGHRGISDEVRGGELPQNPNQVAVKILSQINLVLVEPYMQLTADPSVSEFSEFIHGIWRRLESGQEEARSVFRSLETASQVHLDFVDTVGEVLNAALNDFVERVAEKFSKP